MCSVGAHPYGPGRDVVAGQELESGHCGVPAARARGCAESTVAVDWRTGGPSSALVPNYQCTTSNRDPSTLPGRRLGAEVGAAANATLTSARVHCVSATRGPIRPLAVLAKRKPEGSTTPAGSISSGCLRRPTSPMCASVPVRQRPARTSSSARACRRVRAQRRRLRRFPGRTSLNPACASARAETHVDVLPTDLPKGLSYIGSSSGYLSRRN